MTDPLQSPARQRLREFLRARRQGWQQGTPDFEMAQRDFQSRFGWSI